MDVIWRLDWLNICNTIVWDVYISHLYHVEYFIFSYNYRMSDCCIKHKVFKYWSI